MDTPTRLPSGDAFLALAALDRYHADLERLVRAGPAQQDWARIAGDLRELRRSFAALPSLCAPWLEALMSGLDLLGAVAQQCGAERLQQKFAHHVGQLLQLERCVRAACAHANAT